MFIFLPVLAFAAVFIAIANLNSASSLRQATLRAAVVCGTYSVFSTELLSLMGWVRPTGLAILWGILFLVASASLGLVKSKTGTLRYLMMTIPTNWIDRAMLIGVGLIVLITGVVGLLSPPQSVDSLHYHMSRVAHWAQNGSLRHYATGIEVQNSLNPGAEILILQPYVLTQSDRLVNGVQWMAMLLSVLGVSSIAKQLGGNEREQILASVFVATLPMGIAEASNTLNDYVASFWLVCATVEALHLLDEKENHRWESSLIFLCLATGMTVLTKTTAIPYLILPGLVAMIFLGRPRQRRKKVQWGLIGIIVIFSINAGFLIRNMVTFGGPVDESLVDLHRNQTMDFSSITSSVLRNVGLHMGTPWENVNRQIYRVISGIHVKIGANLNDPRTTSIGEFRINKPTTHEAYTGNPAHAYLLLLSFLLLFIRKQKGARRTFFYGLLIMVGFILFCTLTRWQITGSRYHLPFFVLIAPFAASIVRTSSKILESLVGVGLIVLAWPWLFGIRSRPLIPSAGNSPIASLLTQPRNEFYMVNTPWVEEAYQQIAGMVNDRKCSQIGLMLGGSGMEYLFWAQLGAPRNDLQMEWIVAGTPSDRYIVRDLVPCAVICERCIKGMERVQGLPIVLESGDSKLFMVE